MSDSTKIQWTDTTWNPVTGCTKVSAGCANCYAERDWPRHYGKQTVPVDPGVGSPPPGYEFEYRPRRFTDVRCHQERLDEPLRWKKPRRVFVNSMADLFHDDVPDEFIARVFAVMSMARDHTFQVLTKRPHRMRQWMLDHTTEACLLAADEERATGALQTSNKVSFLAHAYLESAARGGVMKPAPWPLPNVWLGVSAEDQATADDRIPILLDTPAAVRFVSAEPLLGPIDLRAIVTIDAKEERSQPIRPVMGCGESIDALRGERLRGRLGYDCARLDWVIVGGESGPKSRPCDVAWIRGIVEQCGDAGVACFVKQLGAFSTFTEDVARFSRRPESHDECRNNHKDRKGGDPGEWPVDLCVRQWPNAGGGA